MAFVWHIPRDMFKNKWWLWRNMPAGKRSHVVSDMQTRPQCVGSQNNWASNNYVTWCNFPEYIT